MPPVNVELCGTYQANWRRMIFSALGFSVNGTYKLPPALGAPSVCAEFPKTISGGDVIPDHRECIPPAAANHAASTFVAGRR